MPPRFTDIARWTGPGLVVLVLLLTTGCATGRADAPRLSSTALAAYLDRINPAAVHALDPDTRTYRGADTCSRARDGVCDDRGIGTGLCERGSDFSDCWRIAEAVEDDSCITAGDGICDEAGFGTGLCPQATDRSDCGALNALRFRDDSCARAFDGVCNEPETGDGQCAARTDRSDCAGRSRPAAIRDHFFGHDDRVLLDVSAYPWSAAGEIDLRAAGTCSAILVRNTVAITAAHCISHPGGIDARGVFRSAGGHRARIVSYLIDPDWDDADFHTTDRLNATDWALLRLDQPVGASAGTVPPISSAQLTDTGPGTRLFQAGYSWDTGEHLSGHAGCAITAVRPDTTFEHDCDTTRGDSGGALLTWIDDTFVLLGTDSRFTVAAGDIQSNLAVRADRWSAYLDDFEAARIGSRRAR